MLDNLGQFLPLPPPHARPCRLQVFTKYVTRHFPTLRGTYGVSLPESSIAPFLGTLQKRVNSQGIRIGSYPLLQRGVYVSLIGANRDRVREVAEQVEKEVEGRIVSEEEAEAKRRSSGA